MQVILCVIGHYGIQSVGVHSIESGLQRREEFGCKVQLIRRLEIVLEAVAAQSQKQRCEQQDADQSAAHLASAAGIWARASRRSSLLNSSGILIGSRPGM